VEPLNSARIGTLIKHVLQQVSHAGFSVPFVPGSDHIGDIDRDRGFGIIGEQQYVESVIELIFRDSFHGSDFGLSECESAEKHGGDENPHRDKASIDAVLHTVKTIAENSCPGRRNCLSN
jgi:hypothetical protein